MSLIICCVLGKSLGKSLHMGRSARAAPLLSPPSHVCTISPDALVHEDGSIFTSARDVKRRVPVRGLDTLHVPRSTPARSPGTTSELPLSSQERASTRTHALADHLLYTFGRRVTHEMCIVYA